MEDYAEKMLRFNEYIEALEEERRKIQVFQRELPLCLELVTQAIDGCRQQLSGPGIIDYFHGGQPPQQSYCSEQTSSDVPVLEEFIPIKRCSSDDDDDDEEQSHKPNINTDKSGKKSDWLRSVQLWNQTPDPSHKEDPPKKESVIEAKKNGGAFRPFNKEKDVGTGTSPAQKNKSPPAVPTAASSSSAGTVSGRSGGSRREDKQGESHRKQRRCWSPELHRRFLNALQQLGGALVATPKQIRDFMKVDGLTNDEVKSHLQKYRLHTRRPSSGINNNGNPQFVVVGGIWVQPPEYAKMEASAASGEATGVTTANGIYAPVAAPPASHPQAPTSLTQRRHHNQSKDSQPEENGSHSTSPATSSSTHATTASHVF